MKKKFKIIKKILGFHLYVGLGISLLLIHLSITGIFLNHTDDLELNKTYISSTWILNLYGLNVPRPSKIFTIQQDNFSQFDTEVFFNNKPIFIFDSELIGVIKDHENFIIAARDELFIVNQSGVLIDQQKILSFTIKSIGKYKEKIVIKDEQLNKWVGKSISDKWAPIIKNNLNWSQPGTMTPLNKKGIKQYFVGNGISLEQIILDFHSGAIFKKEGKLFFDLVSILLIFLSISGIWIWLKKRKRGRS
ncbi:PepSY domain-containing protein [Nitrosomonadales bacterium]|nr:PepSY domain-containing protein [Nitrosomonadales bacterium]